MGPLSGIRVLDLTHAVAGPVCTMMLGDLGAEIIKVEKPGRGDNTRYNNISDRFVKAAVTAGGDYFLAINRNKRSIAIDMKTERGKKIILELAKNADVAVQNFRPGTVERLGLRIEASRADIFGTGALHGRRIDALGATDADPPEVFARYAARTAHRADANRLSALQAPMHHGPPALAGSLAAGRGQVSRIYSHWGTVIPVARVRARVGFVPAGKQAGSGVGIGADIGAATAATRKEGAR